jgi:UDP-glucose 4-epimerase
MSQTAAVGKKERILLTGNAGGFGMNLTKSLIDCGLYEVMSVDQRPFAPALPGLTHYQLDLRRKSALELLRKLKPHCVIHLGVTRNPHKLRKKRENAYFFNMESTAQLLRLAESLHLRKFIYLSTANLYGPSGNTSGFIKEDALLHGASASPEFRDLVTLDMMVQSCFWKMPKTETIILRPCHIVGADLKNAPSRYFQLETIPTLLGFDPMLQLMHDSDLIEAILLSLRSKARGIFNLAGVDQAPLSRMVMLLERPHISLPEKLFKALMATTFFYKKSSFPVAELDHLKYSCLVDDGRAREELGYEPKRNTVSILQEMKKQFMSEHGG